MQDSVQSPTQDREKGHFAQATLASGCFWCTEATLELLKGVERVVSGYANGHTAEPTYEDVCTGTTGHAECVQVTFDPAIIPYRTLLLAFFATHDPTTLNRQGADTGTQYRSAIFTQSPEQEATAKELVAELTAEAYFPRPIVTQIEPLQSFTAAEAYHQGYFRANPRQPYCQAVAGPKVAKMRQQFAALLKE